MSALFFSVRNVGGGLAGPLHTLEEFLKEGDDEMTKKKLYIILGIILAATILSAVILFMVGKSHYEACWYNGTSINDVDVSGQSLEESKAIMEKKLQDYSLSITGRDGGSLVIDKENIDLTISFHQQFDEIFQKEHAESFFLAGGEAYTINYDVTYDENKLTQFIEDSKIVQGDDDYKIVKPKSARVIFSKEKNQYECVPEVPGNQLDVNRFQEVVREALLRAETQIDISNAEKYPDVYKPVKVTSDNESLQADLKACNGAALRYIVWNMGEGVKEKITPLQISKWITCEDGKIKYDDEKISDWVEKICLKYKTVGKTRKVRMHNKKMVKVVGGDYGWQINYEAMLEQVKKALKKKIKDADIQAYIESPDDTTKKALTLKRKVLYANTAFQKDYENFTDDWDKENFTEVSLSEQKVYVIRNGKVAFSCRCITGKPVPDRETRKGAYFIKEHNESRVLVGETYRTPVTSWVRITWTGTGFHAATWQNWGSWSPDRYKTNGSHGCINLSYNDALKIYKMTKYREAVFIY